MANFNLVVLAGNLGRDPELRTTKTGMSVCEVGLAINNKRKEGEDWKTETIWLDVTFWDNTAELLCQYCRKGSCILVEGRLTEDRWQDKEGNKRSKIKVTANRLQFLDRKEAGGQPTSQPTALPPAAQATSQTVPDIDGDNCPF